MLPRGVVKSWHGYAVAAFLVAGSAESAVAAETAFASNFDKAQTSSARLVAGGRDSGGVYLAGVEIDLEPKTVTYWRQPGDAGSPPVFDFSESQNVASVETLYPAPKHMNEAGSIVAGYDTAVTFPLRVNSARSECAGRARSSPGLRRLWQNSVCLRGRGSRCGCQMMARHPIMTR